MRIIGMTAIMNEIYANGPVTTAFTLNSDFYKLTANNGIYYNTGATSLGGHAVVIVGWGATSNGTLYWIIQNTWGSSWGNNGFFLFRRG
jgi:cathepsin B